MGRSRPLTFVAGAAFVVLVACAGGPEEDGGPSHAASPRTGTYGEQGTGTKDAERQGPAAEITGATRGGTITVYLPGAPGPDTLDPTGAWSVTGNAIQQALVSRSLTQYASDADGQPVLVPDLATDLGRHNDDFTEWTFTIREDATWQDGRPVTPEEVAFGICRSLDSETFPAGPGTQYSKTYFAGAASYDGPYTAHDPDCDAYDGISVHGQDVTITMDRPFPDMDYWGAVMAMGPAPLGDAADPPDYGHRPLASGPYKVESWEPAEELVLVRNDAWSADSDPARHQYAERWVFKFNQDQDKVDEIMLSDSAAGQAAVATALGPGRYRDAEDQLGERLVQQPSECVTTLTPDYTQITDIRVRKALAYAYPYEDVWIASGEVPGVTRVPAGSIMPPGMAGRKEFHVDGEQITYDPEKSRELLSEAGYGDEPYRITMIYYAVDPQAAAAQQQITAGFEAGGFAVRAIPVQESPYSVWLDPDDEVNRLLNVRAANLCPAWPAGSALLPPLLGDGAVFNTAHFDEPAVDAAMDDLATLPIEEQPAAWGELDETIMTDYFPTIPTAYVNRLVVFGARIGNPSGDGSMASPNYKDLYVVP
ncbi:MAG: ABC transporter substrate-binding protein [Nocardioides sp.]